MVLAYPFADDAPRTQRFGLTVEGMPIDVLATDGDDYASFAVEGPAEVEVRLPSGAERAIVRPLRHGIAPSLENGRIRFLIPGPIDLMVECDGHVCLHIYANPVHADEGAGADLVFGAGDIHHVGELRLEAGQHVHFSGGAIVHGCLRASEAHALKITGPGVLDGGYDGGPGFGRAAVIEGSHGVRIQDLTMIRPCGWMLTLGACEDVTVEHLRQIGTRLSSDGVDVVGSRQVRVRNSFLRNGDDCVVVKSLDLRRESGVRLDHTFPVEDVEFSGCAIISYRGGNAMEIGHELRTDSVRNIRFRDIDVMGVHQFGSVFGIHNADRARIEDVLYEDIRVEHHYDKLVDFRVVKSRWGKDAERGSVKGVTLRNVDVRLEDYNHGYTSSLIGGYDAGHRVEDVRFENFVHGGRKAMHPDELDLFVKYAEGIRFA